MHPLQSFSFLVMNQFKFDYYLVIVAVLSISFTTGQQPREVRRIPDDFLRLKQTTTPADLVENDDVFAIPIDDFRALDYWYGRRLKKRSLLSFDEPMDKKSDAYYSWGGKRRLIDIFQMPKGFHPNGGKRITETRQYNPNDKEGRKRTIKAFKNWAGKRSNTGKPFIIWGGKKRANTFQNWGGKRSGYDSEQLSNVLVPDTQLSSY